MKNRTLYVVSLLMIVALALAACAPAATTMPEPTSAPAQPTEAPPAPADTMAPTEVPPTEAPMAPAIDCMGAQAGDELTVVYQWSGAEEEKINAIFAPFVEACGVKIVAESTRDDAILDTKVKSTPPDLLFWPNVSPLTLYTDQLIPLTDMVQTRPTMPNSGKTWAP